MTTLDWTHGTADIPAAGLKLTRIATGPEREATAKALGLLDCPALTVTYAIRPLRGGRYALDGSIAGDAVQACVVTVEPVASRIELNFDVTFAPEGAAVDAKPADETELDVLALPEVEPIAGGQLEVGRVVYETLAAGLDPYPRAAGAKFEWEDPRGDVEVNPFAVLAKLKGEQQR
jgi:uncharacterized metal-binding protein YceD (DUF177 family)